MPDFDSLVLSSVFAEFGKAAIYSPADGTPIACTVLFRRPDRDWTAFGAGVTVPATIAEMRVAEVAEVAEVSEGDTVTVGPDTYTVQSASQPDDDRLIWRLELA